MVEIVATISSFYLILLSVAFEVFFSANVQSLANFISPNAVLKFRYVAGKPNTNLADSQYRAALRFARLFFFVVLVKVEKSLIIKK